ncbi:MAG: YfhO family protein [Planctomycetota bacterium]|nr:YfhO family protein [Planctomycetota bacterium]
MNASCNTSRYESIGCFGLAVGLTYVFWSSLWHGGGLAGGDVYSYFLPQKHFYAEQLQRGELALWNNRAGHGYPIVAESQTGVYYPPNVIAYRLLDLNTAYNTVQLAHYVMAFFGVCLYARAMGLSLTARILAAVIFTYGWFPARISLEWAIVTGAWLPWALWSVERFLATNQRRHAVLLSSCLALQMSVGHYNLAFITQLVLAAYTPIRVWWVKKGSDAIGDPHRRGIILFAAIGCGFLLVAFQLLPTFELKAMSQRADGRAELHHAQGYIPPVYLTQCIAPWMWYGMDVDLNRIAPDDAPPTNAVEAHLYFGLVAIVLIAIAVLRQRLFTNREQILWGLLGLAATVYSTGVLVPWFRSWPGFGFFEGPGRYGIVATLCVAMLAGWSIDAMRLARRWLRVGIGVIAVTTTIADLWYVPKSVAVAVILEKPIIDYQPDSPIRNRLAEETQPVRLFCRGPNLPTLLGVASAPPWLGLGPRQYFDPLTKIPGDNPFDDPPTTELIDWLRRGGVTHVLSFHRLDESQWPVQLLWEGFDPFLNRAWARLNPPEPFFLYELKESRGRVAWAAPHSILPSNGSLQITEYAADRVVIECQAKSDGQVVLTDLDYPGWTATVDGEPTKHDVVDGMYRGVQVSAGRHRIEWTFRPTHQRLGFALSACCVVLIAIWLVSKRRRS